MRLIITGAAGFIGSVLTKRAIEIGCDVVAIDSLVRGLNPVWELKDVTFIQHDCQGGFLEALPISFRRSVDAVVHLAAGTGSLDRPIDELRQLNVEMTKRVYQDAQAIGAKVFVFPTTSLALGVPDSPYVQTKEEAMTWVLQQESEMRLAPLRFFNVVGAYKGFTERRQKEVHIIPMMVEALKTKVPFIINGRDYETVDGTPSRDFINVLDVVETILWDFIEPGRRFAITAPKMPDGTHWLGTGRTTTVQQALDIFSQWIAEVPSTFGPRRAFDVGEVKCDVNSVTLAWLRARRQLAPAWVGIRDEALALTKKLHIKPPLTSTLEACGLCGYEYPRPVGHHHTPAECSANQAANLENQDA